LIKNRKAKGFGSKIFRFWTRNGNLNEF